MGAANSSENERRARELDKRSKELDKRAEGLDKREKELEKREKELKKSGGMSLLRRNSGESETPNNCGCWYNQKGDEPDAEPYSFFCQNTGCAVIRSPSPGSILTKLLCCC
ncbi:hypothetical protein F2P79_021248 [Pimephales promelas]|nr:hypothetical protein F2P79_021248 [Pimephales promelas]